MTKAEYLQRGESLDYTNATEDTIPDGAVVTIGSRIGVTGCPIPPRQDREPPRCRRFRDRKERHRRR